MRLLSWNVRDMLGDPLAVYRVIRAAQPDVVCLQEGPRWPGSRFRLGQIARATGLTFVAGGRASAGTCVLIGPGVILISARAARLPVRGWRARPRGVVLVSVALKADPAAPPLSILCLHLGLQAAERAQHVEIIRQRLSGQPHLVLAGDLNEVPGGESWESLSTLVSDPQPDAAPTFPARHQRFRIDAVLANRQVRVLEYDTWRPEERDLQLSSDHRPVLAVVTTTDGPDRFPPGHESVTGLFYRRSTSYNAAGTAAHGGHHDG